MVLALVEHDDGEPLEESLQMLTLAREIAASEGTGVEAVAFGDGTDELASSLGEYGVVSVHAVVDGVPDAYAPVAWGATVDALIDATGAPTVIAAGTDRGNEIFAHLGALTGLPMVANCLEVTVEETYDLRRQRWGGSLIEHAHLDGSPKLLTAAVHELAVEAADEPTSPAVEAFTPDLSAATRTVQVARFEPTEEEGVSIKDAEIVIGGGRGVGSAEDFAKLEELAELLGAAVGSSRAAVNEGWRPHDDQIGLTGHKISPEIYIAAGISGAVQHMVGAKGSKHILAINTDPEAGIIQKSNWAILGDLHDVIPAIAEEVRQRQTG